MMPIKPENMSKYPGGSTSSPEWRAIRKRIAQRSGGRCEKCRAPNGKTIARGSYNGREAYMVIETSTIFCAETGLEMAKIKRSDFNARKVLKIILTVAHLNHDETDNRDENLAHLCQRDHLRHDHKHHMNNAARTRRNRGGQLDLEDMLG